MGPQGLSPLDPGVSFPGFPFKLGVSPWRMYVRGCGYSREALGTCGVQWRLAVAFEAWANLTSSTRRHAVPRTPTMLDSSMVDRADSTLISALFIPDLHVLCVNRQDGDCLFLLVWCEKVFARRTLSVFHPLL